MKTSDITKKLAQLAGRFTKYQDKKDEAEKSLEQLLVENFPDQKVRLALAVFSDTDMELNIEIDSESYILDVFDFTTLVKTKSVNIDSLRRYMET